MAQHNEIKSQYYYNRPDLHIVGGTFADAIEEPVLDNAVKAIQGASLNTFAKLHDMASLIAIGKAVEKFPDSELEQSTGVNKEDSYLRYKLKNLAYADSVVAYDSYAPAYRFGISAYSIYNGRDFNEIEPQLAKDWDTARDYSNLDWDAAKIATKDAYMRLCKRYNS